METETTTSSYTVANTWLYEYSMSAPLKKTKSSKNKLTESATSLWRQVLLETETYYFRGTLISSVQIK